MEELLKEIIQKIHSRKRKEGRVPSEPLSIEIRRELFHRMEIELTLMVDDGKLKSRDTINYPTYELSIV